MSTANADRAKPGTDTQLIKFYLHTLLNSLAYSVTFQSIIACSKPFRPLQEGHDPVRVVFVPATSEPEKFAEAQKRFNAFKSFYAEYKKVEFPEGRTFALEDLADNAAPPRLAEFESSYTDRLASVTGRVAEFSFSNRGMTELRHLSATPVLHSKTCHQIL